MPVNQKLMLNLKKEYWKKKWENVYYWMENSWKNMWVKKQTLPLKKKKWKN